MSLKSYESIQNKNLSSFSVLLVYDSLTALIYFVSYHQSISLLLILFKRRYGIHMNKQILFLDISTFIRQNRIHASSYGQVEVYFVPSQRHTWRLCVFVCVHVSNKKERESLYVCICDDCALVCTNITQDSYLHATLFILLKIYKYQGNRK